MKVEYLLAYDDNRWETMVVDVPFQTLNRETLVDWAEKNLAGQAQYRKVVLFTLYSILEQE